MHTRSNGTRILEFYKYLNERSSTTLYETKIKKKKQKLKHLIINFNDNVYFQQQLKYSILKKLKSG